MHQVDGPFLGRRGVLGWNHLNYDGGLLLNGPFVGVPELELSFSERILLNAYQDPWTALGYLGGGALLMISRNLEWKGDHRHGHQHDFEDQARLESVLAPI